MSKPLYPKRLLKELRVLQQQGEAEGITVEESDAVDRWVIRMRGPAGSLYEGETFRLQFRFLAKVRAAPRRAAPRRR